MLSVTLAHNGREPTDNYRFEPVARSNVQAMRFDVHARSPATGPFGRLLAYICSGRAAILMTQAADLRNRVRLVRGYAQGVPEKARYRFEACAASLRQESVYDRARVHWRGSKMSKPAYSSSGDMFSTALWGCRSTLRGVTNPSGSIVPSPLFAPNATTSKALGA